MVTAGTLPEAVRGNWYYFESPPEDDVDPDGSYQVVSFDVDGSYARDDIDGSNARCVNDGDYTFDGNFLIIRSGRTKTYRVKRSNHWRWTLEDKSCRYTLLRGPAMGDGFNELPAAVCRDIRLVPLRARIEADFDGDGAIYRVVYAGQEDEQQLLGAISCHPIDDRSMWIGVAPCVRGLGDDIWRNIVDKSFVDAYLNNPQQCSELSVQLFGGSIGS